MSQSVSRFFPIDLLKAVSIIAVVSFHSVFVPASTYKSSLYLVDTLFTPLRFCVPVLLTISFFLLERGLNNSYDCSLYNILKKRFIRLIIPTVFWFFLAAGLRLSSGSSLNFIIKTILNGTIFTGAYYLLVLLQLLPIFVVLHSKLIQRKIFLITFCLQGVVVLLVYVLLLSNFGQQILLMLQNFDRPLVIYWFVYMALGAYFYNNWSKTVEISKHIPNKLKLIFLILTGLAMSTEFCLLRSVSAQPVKPFDYVMFSCILSVVVLFICFASIEEQQVPFIIRRAVQIFSKYSLGIFCINGVITFRFNEFAAQHFIQNEYSFGEILLMKFIWWFLLLLTSLMLSILLSKIKLRACVC